MVKPAMKQKAFTLIELLVVIAIIAILAAILFPVFAQAKLAAKKIKATSQMKQLGTGTMIYLADYDDKYPPKVRIQHGPSNGGGDPFDSMTWDDLIFPYVKSWDMFVSSEDNRPNYEVPGRGQYRRSYAPTANLFVAVQPPASWGETGFGSLSNTSTNVADTVMFVEARQPVHTGITDIRNADQWWWDVAAYNTRTADLPLSDPRSCCGQIDNVYSDASNYVFADTHTKVIKRNGSNVDGDPAGTLLPGYEEKAAWWVGSTDPFWDQGIACFDAPWWPREGQPCALPQD